MRLHVIAARIAAIEKWEMRGNWAKNSGFGAQDRKLLTNPKAVEKIQNVFAHTKHRFFIYLLNSPAGRRHVEEGEVLPQRVQTDLEQPDIKATEGVITIVFTNNMGSQRKPFTAWIMAHRFAHALGRQLIGYFSTDTTMNAIMTRITLLGTNIVNKVYGGNVKTDNGFVRSGNSQLIGLFHELGTFRSARMQSLTTPYEFARELFAQWLVTGKIQMNPLPDKIQLGTGKKRPKYLYQRQQVYEGGGWAAPRDNTGVITQYNAAVAGLVEELDRDFDVMLDEAAGKVFVM